MQGDLYEETVPVPRAARFPVELRPPPGFRPEEPATWPKVEGALEYVGGRLLYMPPTGDIQQDVAGAVAGLLDRWVDEQPEFVFGANGAGMVLGGDVRGADAAVWRRDALGPYTGGYRRVPPVLAVEVAGREQGEPELREKAAWYLSRGVKVVWLVLSDTREVVVLDTAGESRHRAGQSLPPCPELPGLAPEVGLLSRRLR